MEEPAALPRENCIVGGEEALSRLFVHLAALCVGLNVLVVFGGSVARALRVPFLSADEYAAYLAAGTVFLALASVTRQRQHIAATVFVDLLPYRARRVQRIIADLLLLLFSLFILFYCWKIFYGSYSSGTRSQGLSSTLLFIPQGAMVVGLAMFVLQSALAVLESMREPLADEGGEG